MPIVRGVDASEDVYPILVDANGRVYVILHDPASVARGDTTAAYPDGLAVFGWRASNAAYLELPSARYNDSDDNKGYQIVPVTPMTSERVEGTKITDGTTTALVDPDLEALLTVPIEHNLVHDGVVFSCFHSFLLTAAATSKWLHVKVPATHIAHMRFRFMSEAKIDYYVYENPTLTNDGTALTEFDINRVTANASNVDVFHTPTITNVGTMIDNGMIGTNGFLTDTGGSISPMRDWVFNASESYLIGANNNDAAAKDIVIQLSWYEEEV